MTQDNNLFEKLKAHPRPVVVDFWAPWCGPCRMVDPVLKQLGKQYEGQVDVWKVNADEHPEVLRALRIYGIPTVIGFSAGQEVMRYSGAAGPDVLSRVFDAALSGEKPPAPPLTILDRLIRLAIGGVLLALAYSGGFSGFYLVLALLAGVAFFTAVYDRCPVWQAISPRLKALFGRS